MLRTLTLPSSALRSWPHPSSVVSPSPSPNIRSCSPTQRATRCTSPISKLPPGAFRYTFVRETRSRKTVTASGVLNESQSAARKAR